ncbi:hypothetical protein MRX96_006631 [Rhipicephalus microplus]
MKRGVLNDPVTHYILFQPEIGTEETSQAPDTPGDDAVYVVDDSPDHSGAVATEEWLSASEKPRTRDERSEPQQEKPGYVLQHEKRATNVTYDCY